MAPRLKIHLVPDGDFPFVGHVFLLVLASGGQAYSVPGLPLVVRHAAVRFAGWRGAFLEYSGDIFYKSVVVLSILF